MELGRQHLELDHHPATGDYDGDGKTDFAFVYGCCGPYQCSVYTLTSTGPAFTAPALRWQGGIGPRAGQLYARQHRHRQVPVPERLHR